MTRGKLHNEEETGGINFYGMNNIVSKYLKNPYNNSKENTIGTQL